MTYWRASRREAPALGALNSSMLPGSTRVLVRELKSLPPLPSGAIFKPSDLNEPPPHKFSAFEGFLISLVTVAAVVIAGAVLLFVES